MKYSTLDDGPGMGTRLSVMRHLKNKHMLVSLAFCHNARCYERDELEFDRCDA